MGLGQLGSARVPASICATATLGDWLPGPAVGGAIQIKGRASVLADIKEGYISEHAALETYGQAL
jgi:hypothetical protein